jgi:hypothetical protein
MDFGALQCLGIVEPRRHYAILIMMVQRSRFWGGVCAKGAWWRLALVWRWPAKFQVEMHKQKWDYFAVLLVLSWANLDPLSFKSQMHKQKRDYFMILLVLGGQKIKLELGQLQKSWICTWSCNCSQIFRVVHKLLIKIIYVIWPRTTCVQNLTYGSQQKPTRPRGAPGWV